MSFLADRLLASSPSGGTSAFTLAKKRAALALKLNTDAEGNPTAKSYQTAAAFIAPFADSSDPEDAADANGILAGYQNENTAINAARQRQLRSLGDFKRREYDSYFSSSDLDVATFRNAGVLALNTSEELDSIVLDLVGTINSDRENGHETDELEGFLEKVTQRADAMRDFANKVQTGELGQGEFVGNFGYYVDADPDTGKVRGAAILPVNLKPDGIGEGYDRAPVTTTINGAVLPVYMPVGQDVQGRKVMRAGTFTWAKEGNEPFDADDAKTRKQFGAEGSFSLDDRNTFSVADNSRPKGTFAKAVTGFDENGNPVYKSMFYGKDGKKYLLKPEDFASLSADPVLGPKANGYIPSMSPGQFSAESVDALPFSQDVSASENKMFHNERKNSLLAENGVPVGYSRNKPPIGGNVNDNVNRQNVPDEAPVGGIKGIIEKGKSFFRKAL